MKNTGKYVQQNAGAVDLSRLASEEEKKKLQHLGIGATGVAAGALGLGAYGVHRATKSDDDEKTAGDLTPMVPGPGKKKKSPLSAFQFKSMKAAGEDFKERQALQDTAFRQHAPLSADIAMQEGSKRLKNHEHMAYMLGRHLRKQRPASELETSLGYSPEELDDLDAAPGREIMIPMSKKSSPILDPLKHTVQDTWADIMGALQRRTEDATKITKDPSTHPAYYPSLALGLPKAFQKGFKDEHQHITGKVNKKIDTDLASAKAEFEAALSGKSEDSALAKIANVIEKFAELSIKVASGELNQILNAYLGFSTALGSGAFVAGHEWAKKNDKNVQHLKAVKELMRQRAYLQPPVILADTNDSSGAHDDSAAPHDRKALSVNFEPAKSETSEAVHAD
jgi:hypothetical protein